MIIHLLESLIDSQTMDGTWTDYHFISHSPNNHRGKLAAEGYKNISQVQKQGTGLNLKWQPEVFDSSSSYLDTLWLQILLKKCLTDL